MKELLHFITSLDGLFLVPMLVILVVFPGIDLVVSGWFFAEGRFFWRHHSLFEFVRTVTPPLTIGMALFVALLGTAAAMFREPFLAIRPRTAVYLLSSLATGPGLLANALFKEHWGRARPSTLIAFGGDKTFTPALVMSDQCKHNCSFVSGHAALAFWMMAFALLAPPPWRRWAMVMALLYGSFVGFVRVAQGGHFLSDVVFAAVLTGGVAYGLHWLIFPSPHGAREGFQSIQSGSEGRQRSREKQPTLPCSDDILKKEENIVDTD